MDFVRGLLNEQRKRLVGTLMQYVEETLYPLIDATHDPVAAGTMKRELRSKVIGAVGQYHDAALDMLKVSVNDGSQANDEALRLLRLIHGDMTKEKSHAQ